MKISKRQQQMLRSIKKEYYIRFSTNLNECIAIIVKSNSWKNAIRQLKRKYDIVSFEEIEQI